MLSSVFINALKSKWKRSYLSILSVLFPIKQSHDHMISQSNKLNVFRFSEVKESGESWEFVKQLGLGFALKRDIYWREALSWSCESEGSGVILDEGMSLISCQVFSNLIRHYRRTFRAVNWQMEVSKVLNKRVPLIVSNVY